MRLAASFRGVKFYLNEKSLTAERKLIVSEFPFSDKRTISDLGRKPLQFAINGFLSARADTSYQDKVSAVLDAFYLKSGPGVFVHPTLGEFNCEVKSFSLNESDKKYGIADFSAQLYVSEENSYPVQAANNKAIIESFAQEGVSAGSRNLSNNFKICPDDSFGFLQGREAILVLSSKFNKALDKSFSRTESLSNTAGEIEKYASQATSFMTRPTLLAEQTEQIFNGLRNCSLNAKERFDIFRGFFSDLSKNEQAGYYAQNRVDSLSALDFCVNVMAHSLAMATVKEMEFNTREELSETLEILGAAHDNILAHNSDESIMEALTALKTEVSIYCERLNVPSTIIVTSAETSPTLLSYDYYGDTDKTEEIIKINGLKDIFISGEVKILNE